MLDFNAPYQKLIRKSYPRPAKSKELRRLPMHTIKRPTWPPPKLVSGRASCSSQWSSKPLAIGMLEPSRFCGTSRKGWPAVLARILEQPCLRSFKRPVWSCGAFKHGRLCAVGQKWHLNSPVALFFFFAAHF